MKRARSSEKKKSKKLGAQVRPHHIVQTLPAEMLAEILAHVGASSAVDLFRCKLSCKAFQEIAEEKQVLHRVAIKTLYSRHWSNFDKAESYFRRCKENNNPEAIYPFGMVLCFKNNMIEEGLKNLQRAATLGHKDAIYVLVLILLCAGNKELIQIGKELLMNLMTITRGEGIVECRRKLKDMMSTFFMETPNIMQEPKISCAKGKLHEITSIWHRADYFDKSIEENIVCETCKCARELDFFCEVMGDRVARN